VAALEQNVASLEQLEPEWYSHLVRVQKALLICQPIKVVVESGPVMESGDAAGARP